jgi:hypothetical protein
MTNFTHDELTNLYCALHEGLRCNIIAGRDYEDLLEKLNAMIQGEE